MEISMRRGTGRAPHLQIIRNVCLEQVVSPCAAPKLEQGGARSVGYIRGALYIHVSVVRKCTSYAGMRAKV
jgi:hypothetical protein